MQQMYRCFNGNGDLLYVGVSLFSLVRLSDHQRRKMWFEEVKQITIETFATREDALDAECKAINLEHPLFNIMGARRHDLIEHKEAIELKKPISYLGDKRPQKAVSKKKIKTLKENSNLKTEEAPRTYLLAKMGLINRKQFAEELRISEKTIAEKWEKMGLPVYRVGDQRFYDVKEVVAWFREVGSQKAA